MKCNVCKKELTKENKKLVNGGLYKSHRCKACYNKKIAVYNKKRQKALKEAKWY